MDKAWESAVLSILRELFFISSLSQHSGGNFYDFSEKFLLKRLANPDI